MEAASFSDAAIRPVSVELALPRTADVRGRDWPLAVVIFGAALSLYAAVGFAVYTLVAFVS